MKLKYIIALVLLFVMVAEMAVVVKIKRDSDSRSTSRVDQSPSDNIYNNKVIRTQLKSSSTSAISSVN
jgi:hypothetical protein